MPVGVQANLRQALAQGSYDVVHGFEPGLPSLSYLALRDTDALAVATFASADRLGYPPARSLREKLLARLDALIALSRRRPRQQPRNGSPATTACSRPASTRRCSRPGRKQKTIVVELRPNERVVARGIIRMLRELPGWEHRAPPHTLADRPPRHTARPRRHGCTRGPNATVPARAAILNSAAIFVPGVEGLRRVTLEAAASGCAIVRPRGVDLQPELAAAATARLAEDPDAARARSAAARAEAERQTFAAVARELEEIYASVRTRRRNKRHGAAPLDDRPWIVADLHMHTSWSHDCSIDAAELVDHAEAEGLGAIAVTDHNVFGGALEAADYARKRDLIVIPGEEVKTDSQGEVIGLFLQREIPRGLSFAETIEAIREQDGIVYVPHPFDRMHAIPDPRTLHRHLADIDVLEVYNARLLFEGYNDEALRFARKYNLTMGAGSDAHVLQGVGTGALRMRAFDDQEEFLLSLRTAEILRRPKSLAYLQSLKWVAQAKEKVR